MFKKIEIWVLYLVILIFFIFTIIFGSLLRNYYLTENFDLKFIKPLIFLAEIPSNTKNILLGGDKPPVLNKFQNKPKFKRYILKKRGNLLILPRYNSDLKRNVVDLIDVDSFKILHTYKHDINKFNKTIKTNSIIHSRIELDSSPIRFIYWHPKILGDTSLIANGSTALFKIDKCEKLIWYNNEYFFHHSVMFDYEENIWASGTLIPNSEFISKFKRKKGFMDDAIFKINSNNGKVLFKKSIIEMLYQNKILNNQQIFDENNDPIHVNDIEVAMKDTLYWEKNDLFISIRNQSAIIHYRPSTNKVINYIKGPFYMQHDVNIISDTEISIFNNNNSFDETSKFSEVLTYNFENQLFEKKFPKSLIKNDFKTTQGGMSQILEDGSLFLDEQDNGRLLFFDNEGNLEWEYLNKADNDSNIYPIRWSTLITDKRKITSTKNNLTKKCLE